MIQFVDDPHILETKFDRSFMKNIKYDFLNLPLDNN